MPIGWNLGAGNRYGGGRAVNANRPATAPAAASPAPAPAPSVRLDGQGRLDKTPDVWAWVEVLQETLTPIIWTRWMTQADERVCPECGPLDGGVWPEDEGPAPPLHVNCRCERTYAWTEWRARI